MSQYETLWKLIGPLKSLYWTENFQSCIEKLNFVDIKV